MVSFLPTPDIYHNMTQGRLLGREIAAAAQGWSLGLQNFRVWSLGLVVRGLEFRAQI